MPEIQYRPATEADIPAALDLFAEAVVDVYRRNNLPATAPMREQWEPSYRHVLRTGIFHVAETDEGRLAGICLAIVRDRHWFLSGFWIRPELQKQRIGGPLLRRVREEGVARGSETFSVWSTVDLTAIATYLRHGMMPGFQILIFTGTPGPILQPPDSYSVETLSLSTAVDVDRQVRGVDREIDHRFWLEENEPRGLARQVIYSGEAIGYYYRHDTTIGPAAWTESRHSEAVLAVALKESAALNSQVRLVVPGINHDAVRFALAAGLRLTVAPHYLTSAPVGSLDRYLISGPTLF